MARVFIPPAMRSLAHGKEFIEASGNTVFEVIRDIDQRFPGFKTRVCHDNSLRPGLSVVVNGSVSALGILQRVAPDAEIHFLPAIGGG